MKVSRSVGYGLLALGYVARNQKKGECVLSQDISKKYKIPLEYLLKIMQQLVKGQILRSKRGPRGGFIMGKTPAQINLLQVVEAIEGPISSDLVAFDDIKNKAKDKFITRTEKAVAAAIAAEVKVLKETKLSTLIA
jgi:Rrf2 family protein